MASKQNLEQESNKALKDIHQKSRKRRNPTQRDKVTNPFTEIEIAKVMKRLKTTNLQEKMT